MTFLGLFKKKKQEAIFNEPASTPLNFTPSASSEPVTPPTPAPNPAVKLQAEDEETSLLDKETALPPSQSISSTPSTPINSEIPAKPIVPEPKPELEPEPKPEIKSEPKPIAPASKEIREMRTLPKTSTPDIVAFPGVPGSGKIFEGIYVKKERYVRLLYSLRANRESLQEQLSNEERLLQVQENIAQDLEKEESLLNGLFEKVMAIESLTKRC